jgi:hypothetical protein
MNRKRYSVIVIAIFGGWLLLGVAGCSRGYKTGSSITPADLAKALPEFPITLPPGRDESLSGARFSYTACPIMAESSGARLKPDQLFA